MKREREHLERRQKLILRNFQSPGDVTMLTALVRDLEKLHPKRFSIGVETQRRDLWKNNPYIEWELCRFGSDATDEGRDGEAEFMRVEYQLIHKSNQQPQRFIHAMHQFFGERLGLDVYPTAFKGDVHLSAMEREARLGFPNGLDQPDGLELPERYWVVQVGATTGANHTHFDLSGVTDLRGKTSGRELIQLIHHWEGVLSPVTFVMHLAAAVPMRSNAPISGEDPRRKFLMMFISGISMRFL